MLPVTIGPSGLSASLLGPAPLNTTKRYINQALSQQSLRMGRGNGVDSGAPQPGTCRITKFHTCCDINSKAVRALPAASCASEKTSGHLPGSRGRSTPLPPLWLAEQLHHRRRDD